MTDEMHAVTSEHDGREQFRFVAKVLWQSSRVDSLGQLVSGGRRDHSDVGKSLRDNPSFVIFLRIGEDDVDRLLWKGISRYS